MPLPSRYLVPFAALAAAACATAPAAPPPPEPAFAAELDAFVARAMDELGAVPGLAVGVYTPDGVYMRGFGVTDIETREPVTSGTVFYNASMTKSFTALAVSLMSERGEIDLSETLSAFAPDAPFPEALRPDAVRLQDLLTHTSGIANDPLTYRSAFTGQRDAETDWALLAVSAPNEEAPLGAFAYTNAGYNILTTLTERRFGASWRELVESEVLAPLGLDRTSTRMSVAETEGWSIARPHAASTSNGPRRVRLEKTDAIMQSAGGMVMSAEDALRWLEMFIHDGRLDGRQVFPAEVIARTRARLAVTDFAFGPYYREHYGLGWHIGRYRDDTLVHHFGAFGGLRAHASYMPEHGIGVAAFSNAYPAGFNLPDIVANYAYDLARGRADALETADAGLADLITQRDRIYAAGDAGAARRAARSWTLTQPRVAYVGAFENALMGAAEVRLEDGVLSIRVGALSAPFEPFEAADAVRVELAPPGGEVIRFVVDQAGVVTGFDLRGVRFERR